jgi:cellulose synthase/poly-beta-1,6-N-acetylglucosamine synthase-like glycosyltransferase
MTISEMVRYTITFLAVYVQVFFLITFLERRGDLKKASAKATVIKRYPKTAIIVPCWNEEKTVHGTIESLLALEYPKDKLEILIIDDGSTDGTWGEISKYEHHPQVRIFQKENGGKHTAVNFGIDQTDAELIGCLDADSFVSSHALADMVRMFQERPEVMAIAPTLIVDKPQNLLQWAQKIEYNMSVYLKKMQAFLNAIHVTPGPFSVFRREVFERIGKFKKAHNTEDQEIAYRMQENHMRIEHCHTAYVYTTAPDTVKKLYKQRLRWIYGFIQNTIDYRRLILRRKYGNFSFFTLPAGIISITAAVYIFFVLIYNFIVFIGKKISQYSVTGFSNSMPSIHFDWFYINTKTIFFVTVILYVLMMVAMVTGTRMAKQKLSWHIITFTIIYSIIAPFWLLKAIWDSLLAKKPSWR